MWLIFTCAAAICGIALGEAAQPTPVAVVLAGLGGALALFRWRVWGTVLTGFALGAMRALAPPVSVLLVPPDRLAPLREGARSAIAAYLPEPHASLASGVLLGGSGHLDAGFKLDLQRSGLSHLVAIDGFKELVVAGAVIWLFGHLLSRRTALLTSLATVAGYAALTGAHPSAVRAALMVALANLAAVTGRVPDSLTSLMLAVLGMALVDPRVLLDLGLQLSLSATLGIVLLWPHIRRMRRVRRLPRWVRDPFGLTVTVTLACLPVSLSAFRVISVISPIAHVVAVPLLPLVLLTAALLGLIASLAPPLAIAAAWFAWLPTSLLVLVVQAFGSAPGAAVTTQAPPRLVCIALAAVLLGYGLLQQPELRSIRTTFAAIRESAG